MVSVSTYEVEFMVKTRLANPGLSNSGARCGRKCCSSESMGRLLVVPNHPYVGEDILCGNSPTVQLSSERRTLKKMLRRTGA